MWGFGVTPCVLSWESDGGPGKGPLMLDICTSLYLSSSGRACDSTSGWFIYPLVGSSCNRKLAPDWSRANSCLSNQQLAALKEHLCIKWVSRMETSSSTPIPNCISLRCIAECGLSGSNSQVHNLKSWVVPSDLPWTPSHVLLPVEPALFPFSKTAHGEEFGEISI